MLTRDQILGANDLAQETVTIPEWGGDIIIREMTGKQRDLLEGMMASRMSPSGQIMSTKDLRAKMTVMSVIGEDGEPMFNDKDIASISGKSGKALDRIVEVVQKLNGLDSEDIDEKAGN